MHIAQLTSVHPRYDTRIFLKQCRSIAASGNSISLVVADGHGDETKDGVRILDTGAWHDRFDRVLRSTRRVKEKALKINADLYHIHDPELLLIGLALKRTGRHVIFDSHENIPQDILTKPYIPKAVRHISSITAYLGLRAICRRLDGIVTATPYIRDTFRNVGTPVVDVNNYPILEELAPSNTWQTKKREVCYIGSMTIIRGILPMIEAMRFVKSDVTLNLGGKIENTDIDGLAQNQAGWDRVNALGFLDRNATRDVLNRSIAGIVTFLPGPNHLESQPNKMFEYMAAGIPVIASDFPLWREIIEGNKCGILVNPSDASSIARAVDSLIDNPEMAIAMGKNGRIAVETRYNWQPEAKKLLSLYQEIIS